MNIASRKHLKTLALVLLAVLAFQVSVRAQDKVTKIDQLVIRNSDSARSPSSSPRH